MTASLLHRQAEQEAEGLPALMLRAQRLAAMVASGAHGRRRAGQGEEFWQFRDSQPGDPLSAIDWRQSGKSDHLYVREAEWSIAHETRFWVDPSGSMRWRSAARLDSKYDRAKLLAVATALLLERAGERIGLFDQPSFAGRSAAPRLAHALLAAKPSDEWPQGPRTRRCTLLLISDFLDPLPLIETRLRRWHNLGLTGHLLQILDPAEESLEFAGRVRLRGLESEGDLVIPHAESLHNAYGEAMTAHRSGLQSLAQQIGWRFTLHHSDRPARSALTHLLAAMSGG